MTKFGIDISTWQAGYPYDKADAEGVEFAILRAGFRTKKDNQFETHYANAKRLGWGVGAYWYMYATSVEGAQAEARAFLKAIAGKELDYPVYLDIEDGSLRGLGRETLNAMVRAFGEIMESAGYYFGVYTNVDWYRNVISGSELNKKYDWWIACWSTGAPSGINYGIWQFGGGTNKIRSNKVAGVVTDQDYAYKDYPTIIKNLGLNGYSKPIPAPQPEPQPEPQPIPEPVPMPEPKPSTELTVGSKVKIVGTGNGSSYGTSNTAYGIGWTRQILKIWDGRPYPYQVGNNTGTTGFYEATALQKL